MPDTVTKAVNLVPLLQRLFARWQTFGQEPFELQVGREESIFGQADSGGTPCNLGAALQRMHSVAVHGINDARDSHDCLYLAFSDEAQSIEEPSAAMAMLLPYIDMALRQVKHLPMQALPSQAVIEQHEIADTSLTSPEALSARETEILSWVAMGKTNADIGMILGISEFTVKNHLQRVFKKLDVTNRAQAVSRLKTLHADA